ncbi:MAG: class I SAM-dependent DNA methyltransferase [Opitutaceae bacterium]
MSDASAADPAPTAPPSSDSPPAALAAFIERWSGVAAQERANYQLFLTELCALLDLPQPDPAGPDTAENAYVFERKVPLHHPDGRVTHGFIDLYRRGSFVLEAKQYNDAAPEPPAFALALTENDKRRRARIIRGSEAWDRAMLAARGQAKTYAENLPASEEPPPFLVTVDVGHTFALYADFTQKGKAYLPFPDARTYRIRLHDLKRPEIRERLRAVWLDPASLDPARKAAAVTREVAKHLADLAKHLEKQHEPHLVASFLSRCLFCMFAEDIGLLPKDGFKHLLESVQGDPGAAAPLLKALFEEMNRGGYSVALRQKLLHFNGGLFSDAGVLPLDKLSLGLLRQAAALEWRHVEPAIFGTLLERALDPGERHKLGAHYTPRAYVERLVLPAVIEPLREEWETVRAAAVTLATRGDLKNAIKEARAFHHQLCAARVLDPACGSGNFLYVTLEHMKRLEGEVLELIESFGDNMRLDLAGETVDPHQFLGVEINPRAATVAELVLWIGYLQWHHRNRGPTEWPEPVLRAFKNIECRDAVLAYDKKEYAKDEHGNIRYVWDRRTMKTDPVTGRDVPDDKAVIPLETYINPRPADWPQADFIVGNPPFIGKSRMREDLGDGYTETLRKVYKDVPDSADFVMFWWHKAAEETIAGRARRFGLITTNSIRQTFNRRVVKRALDQGLSIRFAIPDHPWVDTADGAAVRIAMTVGALLYKLPVSGVLNEPPPPDPSLLPGDLYVLRGETPCEDGSAATELARLRGRIGSGLNIGAELEDTLPLKSNSGLTSMGVMLAGSGFIVDADHAQAIAKSEPHAVGVALREYRNGRDLTDQPRHARVIDFCGLETDEARKRFPKCYEVVLARVKPERDGNRDRQFREKWWLFARVRPELRAMLQGQTRYIATVETAKHRIFQFLEADILPDHRLIAFGTSDAFHLGVLSSRMHVVFALAAGGTLEDRPVYNKTRCFDPFPFPDCTEAQKNRIRALAEELDAHRKRAHAQHGLGLTDIYNVLEKLRSGEALNAKDKAIHDAALVSTLKQLHDDVDAAVAAAHGWPWPLTDAEILERVVALNTERANEEARGLIRWLRPEYQNRGRKTDGREQTALPLEPATQDLGSRSDAAAKPPRRRRVRKPAKQPWPKTLVDRTKAVQSALATAQTPLTAADIASQYTRAKQSEISEILTTLAALGVIRPCPSDGTFIA